MYHIRLIVGPVKESTGTLNSTDRAYEVCEVAIVQLLHFLNAEIFVET